MNNLLMILMSKHTMILLNFELKNIPKPLTAYQLYTKPLYCENNGQILLVFGYLFIAGKKRKKNL